VPQNKINLIVLSAVAVALFQTTTSRKILSGFTTVLIDQ
jgi:hypothetical protein